MGAPIVELSVMEKSSSHSYGTGKCLLLGKRGLKALLPVDGRVSRIA